MSVPAQLARAPRGGFFVAARTAELSGCQGRHEDPWLLTPVTVGGRTSRAWGPWRPTRLWGRGSLRDENDASAWSAGIRPSAPMPIPAATLITHGADAATENEGRASVHVAELASGRVLARLSPPGGTAVNRDRAELSASGAQITFEAADQHHAVLTPAPALHLAGG